MIPQVHKDHIYQDYKVNEAAKQKKDRAAAKKKREDKLTADPKPKPTNKGKNPMKEKKPKIETIPKKRPATLEQYFKKHGKSSSH